MVTTNQIAALSLAAILALITLLGCIQSQPESVPENDQTQGTETFRRVEETRGNEAGRTFDQTSRACIDGVASSESRFGRGVKLMAAGEPIDVEIGHLVPCVSDWNNDGRLDLLVGNFYSYKKPMGGNVWLFLGK